MIDRPEGLLHWELREQRAVTPPESYVPLCGRNQCLLNPVTRQNDPGTGCHRPGGTESNLDSTRWEYCGGTQGKTTSLGFCYQNMASWTRPYEHRVPQPLTQSLLQPSFRKSH